MANEGLFYKLLLWREKRIKEKHFILIISFIVGICTAAAAIILKQLIHFIQHVLTGNFSADGVNYLYLLYPVIGILLAGGRLKPRECLLGRCGKTVAALQQKLG